MTYKNIITFGLGQKIQIFLNKKGVEKYSFYLNDNQPRSITGILYDISAPDAAIKVVEDNGVLSDYIDLVCIDHLALLDTKRVFPYRKFFDVAFSASLGDTIELTPTNKGKEFLQTAFHVITGTLEEINMESHELKIRFPEETIDLINVSHWSEIKII